MKVLAVVLLTAAMMPFDKAWALECNNAITQADMNACANVGYHQAETALDKAYSKVWRRLDGKAQRQLLEVAQHHWWEYEQNDCQLQSYSNRGGSLYAMNYAICLTEAAHQRTAALNEMLDCPEGVLDCVIPSED